ncbi:MAG: hypothetical protein PF692_05460 [Kiritimatiellae bacterium]|jgi:hypothetical protein|nr:hypothetical protein [Kiritimatiellia bacterium]
MDISEQYKDLTTKIHENLPLRAFPIRELVQIFRKNEHPITLKTELSVTSVHNSGDVSGILCTVELVDGYKMACALTHLIFSKTDKLYSEIADYQKKREKRIKQLKLTGRN